MPSISLVTFKGQDRETGNGRIATFALILYTGISIMTPAYGNDTSVGLSWNHIFCRFPPPEARPPDPGETRPLDSLILRQVDPHLAAPAPISRIVFAARRLRLPIRHRQGSNPQHHRSEPVGRCATLSDRQLLFPAESASLRCCSESSPSGTSRRTTDAERCWTAQ